MGLSRSLVFFVCALVFISCASINGETEIDKITDQTGSEEALQLGFQYGGKTFDDAKALVKKRKDFVLAAKVAEQALLAKKESAGFLFRAMQIYQGVNTKWVSPKVVGKLIDSDDEFVRRLGWQLAANRPSDLIRAVIDRHLTYSVKSGFENKVFFSEMALAVKANNLTSSYSIVREGLYEKGGPEFVRTMIDFNPERASQDLMTYLAKATVEDLRQMTQTTVDLASCVAILRFYNNWDLPLGHSEINHIYIYSVSRNNALAELAFGAIERMVAQNRTQLAFGLAKMPVWIQVAFIENSREKLDNTLGLFLTELKQVTSHSEVVEEIDALKR